MQYIILIFWPSRAYVLCLSVDTYQDICQVLAHMKLISGYKCSQGNDTSNHQCLYISLKTILLNIFPCLQWKLFQPSTAIIRNKCKLKFDYSIQISMTYIFKFAANLFVPLTTNSLFWSEHTINHRITFLSLI